MGTYNGGWGYHPNVAMLDRGDGSGEPLGGQLHPGNERAADRMRLLVHALAALPPQAQVPEPAHRDPRGARGGVAAAATAYRCHQQARGDIAMG